ncbi:MAG: 4Fe-4S binding protein [Verrucomicrobia bacterium]|jgi:ferredoxin-type protein NapH|nr:4Fe-4S binding protein [Verrucomicrobiota bacterium]MBT7065273.1 4Fe-4S binding protein [Verrucomicrobiota bacterium]MBT7700228.1 4Fe-4S binding protein [Verrucomicrobiota bacterium]
MMTLPKIAWWRHLTRVAVLLGLLLIAGFNLHRHYKSQYGGQFEIDQHAGLHLIDQLRGTSPHLDRRPVTISGGLWSFKAGPLRTSDPLAVASSILTSRTITVALLLSLLIPLLVILWGGRLFCSWICPMGLLGEAVRGIRQRLDRIGVRFFNLPISGLPKYVLLIGGALACLLFSIPFFYGFYPPRILSDAVRDTWYGTFMTAELLFVGILLLCELVLCERLWCKCLCPGGALLSGLGTMRRLRVQHNPDACTACGACDLTCPYDLDPSRKALGGECDNCGRCIEVCKDSALAFRIGSGPEGKRNIEH